MTPALAVAITLIGVIAVILIGLWIRYRNWRDMQGFFSNVAIFLALVFLIDLVYVAAFDLPTLIDGFWGYIGIVILLGVLVLLHAITLLRFFYLLRPRGPNPATQPPQRLWGLWNWNKALSGSAFADLANSVGVLSGIGAHIILSQNPGWWWVGHLGALLALVVGYSFLQRWLVEGRSETPEAGVLNTTVGVFTILALLTPVSLNPAFLQGWHPIEWFWLLFLGLLTVTLPAALLFAQFNRYQSIHLEWRKLLVGGLLFILLGGSFATLLAFQWRNQQSDSLVFWFGLVATGAWALAELISLGRLAQRWYTQWEVTVVTYMTFEKNLWQVVGALIIVVYLIAKQVGDVAAFGWSLTFAIGAAFAGFGTLRGIVMSLVSRRNKAVDTVRARATAAAQEEIQLDQMMANAQKQYLQRQLSESQARERTLQERITQLEQQASQPQAASGVALQGAP
jgi:hypothetical protein